MLLQDMVNSRIACLSPGDTLRKAVLIFRQYKIDTIPVIDLEEKLVSATA